MTRDDLAEDTLLAAIARGDRDAFATLFRRRRQDVYRFALHMTGVPATADDVTQDAFLIVMREAGKYQPGRATVTAWICGIARNCARQRLDRERGHEPMAEDGDERRAEVPSVHPDPLADLARAERLETLRNAILRLPVRYREVVVLCDLQEMSYADAADALGCAVGTVRSRLHRGRALLAAKLSGAPEPSALKAVARHTRVFA